MDNMNPRLTWTRMKRRQQNVTCHVCGSSRDYLERTGNNVTCTICGNKFFSPEHESRVESN